MRGSRLRKIEIKDRWYRRRYLVPNIVTLGNLFCGFLCIIYASSDRFEKAAIAIGIAILLDGLDGRVARRLNATSQFGIELDSLADLVSFGVAPAMLMYNWAFQQRADEFGVLICFTYCLCAASRLARFNVQEKDLRKFQGLPTPGAAGMVAALIHLVPRVEQTMMIIVLSTLLMLTLASLMVSDITFLSLKNVQIRRKQLAFTVTIGLAIALAWYNPKIGLLVIVSAYCLSGPFMCLWNWFRRDSTDSRKTRAA